MTTEYPPIPPNQPYSGPKPGQRPEFAVLPEGTPEPKTLQEHINLAVSRGWRVVSQTETTAQLVKPKVFSFGFALLWFLLGVVPVFLYILYYAAKRDRQMYLSVDETGRVLARY